jgi:hypothetical protein
MWCQTGRKERKHRARCFVCCVVWWRWGASAHFGRIWRYQSGETDNPGRISGAGDRDVIGVARKVPAPDVVDGTDFRA